MELLDLDVEAGRPGQTPQQRFKPWFSWDSVIEHAKKFDEFSKISIKILFYWVGVIVALSLLTYCVVRAA